MMERHYFVAKMPDEPGALHRAAEIVKRHGGNIDRIQYDKRIDPYTVFFEARCSEDEYQAMRSELQAIGYLQGKMVVPSFLKFDVVLPNSSGALFDFLNHTTAAKCNIDFLDFDDRGKHPERLTVSLTVEEAGAVDRLLEKLKSIYPLEILEYDTTGQHLDDTVFYIRFAQELRALVGEAEDAFLLRLLSDINHVAQELMNLGSDPKQAFSDVLRSGRGLRETSGDGFYADLQEVCLGKVDLLCVQLPCGGNCYLLRNGSEVSMVDTGFGIYFRDLDKLMEREGWGGVGLVRNVLITHGDADHSGSAGLVDATVRMHPDTLEMIRRSDRAYGSESEGSVLAEVYTKLINLFSRFSVAEHPDVYPMKATGKRGDFPVLATLDLAGMRCEVLEGFGGHTTGQVFYFLPEELVLFTGDSLINFESLTEERRDFATLAKNLMTSVNVDSVKASKERKALLRLMEMEESKRSDGRKCLVCGGHGAVSVLCEGKLVQHTPVRRYVT
ncbi:MAG TPA: MBL fold metallo-hydrolase [Methanomassiliicoccales archaeon]|nr:MBL fold metallo-hydrolase [Methanomassiliicoccales archaeon]